MLSRLITATVLVFSFASSLYAQELVGTRDRVAFDSPEGWAMAHASASALNLGSQPPKVMDAWEVELSADLNSVPHVRRDDTRVGFGGFKLEDLNKSPVFGRGTVHIGLPANIQASLSWTPPLRVKGVKPRDLFALALEHPLYQREGWSLGVRLFAQWGDAVGDITCSQDVASNAPGSPANPFGCREASSDIVRLDHHGVELNISRTLGEHWQPFAAIAITRLQPHVQVRAHVFEVQDRSELITSGSVSSMSMGTTYRISDTWSWSTAVAYTPLYVRRPPAHERRSHDHWMVRAGLRWYGALPGGVL